MTTTTATAAAIPGLDPALVAAWEAQPTDWTLVAAMADQAAEAGEEVVADCLQWVRAKRRCPRWHPGMQDSSILYGWSVADECATASILPQPLPRIYDKANGDFWWAAASRSELLQRLCRAWAAATPAERALTWEWEPEPAETAEAAAAGT